MIKFFRKIRQNLVMENKTSKYFKYAIGEIILVVIGILIALQINNWNENRKQEKRIVGYMQSLVEDLKSDITQFDVSLKSYSKDINKNKRLIINDDYKRLEVDSILKLVNIFYMPNWTSTQTYEKIKNAGLSESLVTEAVNKVINDYYNVRLKYYSTMLQWDKEYSTQYYNFWFYNDNYESSSTRGYNINALPFKDIEQKRKEDLTNLIESTSGRNYIRGAIERHEHTRKGVKELKLYAENLVEMINKELDKR